MMQRFLPFLLLLTGLLTFDNAKACVDPDSVVIIIVNYDTLNTFPCPTANQVELRFTNLRLMSEEPNKICACGLSSFSDIFTDLDYIAFVDSGTNNPYVGFTEFLNNASSSASWNTAAPNTGGWTGMVSEVINFGLNPTHAVDLVVRLSAPPNTVIVFDSLCQNPPLTQKVSESFLGTDEWDASNSTLKNDHMSVKSLNTNLTPGSSITYNEVDKAHFTQMDNDILGALIPTGTGTLVKLPENSWNAYPNPASNEVTLAFSNSGNQAISARIRDLSGRVIHQLMNQQIVPAGLNSYTLSLPSNIAAGTYLLEVSQENKTSAQQLFIQ